MDNTNQDIDKCQSASLWDFILEVSMQFIRHFPSLVMIICKVQRAS